MRTELQAAARARSCLSLLMLLCAAACTRGAQPPDAGPPAHPPPAAAPPASAAEEAAGPDEEVRPVYAPGGPIDPLAQRLCRAVHTLVEEKRAACCKSAPGITFAPQCESSLSSALRANAVAVDLEALARCEAAQESTHQGCAWTGAWGAELPPACSGLLLGKLPAGRACRSSLECEAGLHCGGVGPTNVGRCVAAAGDREPCGVSVDALGSVVRQDADRGHPACKGSCNRRRCVAAVALGAPCATHLDCSEQQRCVDKRCEERTPAKEGAVCAGEDCASGLRCNRGLCKPALPTGAACAAELDCLGGCVAGKCAPRCDVR